MGRVETTTDPLGNVTTYAYSNWGRTLTITLPDPDGVGGAASPELVKEYDAAGNLIGETDALGNETTYEYDELNRLVLIVAPDPDGAGGAAAPETEFQYDKLGRLRFTIDALGNTTENVYDARSRLIATILPDPDGGGALGEPTTDYDFDDAGQLLALTDPVGNVTAWEYDALGRVTLETNELTETRAFAYDAAGRLVERTDRLGRVMEFEYDVLDNLIEERWYDGVTLVRTLNWEFDAAGQLTAAYDPAVDYAYSYDALGRLTLEAQSFVGFTDLIEYESDYDAASRRTDLRSILGGTADFENAFSYDNLSRLTRLEQSDWDSGHAVAEKRFDFFYNANSLPSRLDRYADLAGAEYVASTHSAYDDLSRLLRLTHNDSTSPAAGWGTNPPAGYQFSYDAGSRITSINSYIDGLSEFDYDQTSQLVGADHASQADEAYAFDENGNRSGGGYDTDPNNQMATDGTYNYTYDAEGNRATRTKISNGYVTVYEWDHRNRLLKVTEQDDEENVLSSVEYRYDVNNRLIRRIYDEDGPGGDPASEAFLSWEADQINLIFAGDEADDLSARNVWDPAAIDQILATEDVASLAAPGDLIWPFTDHLGTPRDLAEYTPGPDTTAIANHREYNTFGLLTDQTNGSFTIAIGFTGVYIDIVTGLSYHRARWYDAHSGQWTAEDPSSFDGNDPNLRRYVGNSPLTFTDPSGLIVFDKSKYPDSRRNIDERKKDHPDLGDEYEVVDVTRNYNCYAHAARIHSALISSDDLEAILLKRGYGIQDNLNADPEAGYHKIVFYGERLPDGSIRIRHAAIQIFDYYESKLGPGPLIKHATAEQMCGPLYGEIVRIYIIEVKRKPPRER